MTKSQICSHTLRGLVHTRTSLYQDSLSDGGVSFIQICILCRRSSRTGKKEQDVAHVSPCSVIIWLTKFSLASLHVHIIQNDDTAGFSQFAAARHGNNCNLFPLSSTSNTFGPSPSLTIPSCTWNQQGEGAENKVVGQMNYKVYFHFPREILLLLILS